MYLDDKLTKEAYDEKYNEISRKLDKCEEVIVGEQAEDGIVDPYKLTFVLKWLDERCIPDARVRYMNIHNKAVYKLKIEVLR